MENPPFWWYLPGKMGFSWAMLVSGRVYSKQLMLLENVISVFFQYQKNMVKIGGKNWINMLFHRFLQQQDLPFKNVRLAKLHLRSLQSQLPNCRETRRVLWWNASLGESGAPFPYSQVFFIVGFYQKVKMGPSWTYKMGVLPSVASGSLCVRLQDLKRNLPCWNLYVFSNHNVAMITCQI